VRVLGEEDLTRARSVKPSARRKATRLSRQASELMLAAPQVVAHRLQRMARAGAQPSAKDRLEFQRMGLEKVAAFNESWRAMGLQLLKSQQQLGAAMLRGGVKGAAVPSAAAAWQQAMLDIASQGLRPVHRRATANARRLGGKR
jgi:hypothetical protein